MDSESVFGQLVPKVLVHKWSLDQVFITKWEKLSEGVVRFAAELPRSHGFYCERLLGSEKFDLTLMIEVCRQACFIDAHLHYGVPLGGDVRFQFLFQELEAELFSSAKVSDEKAWSSFKRPVDIYVGSEVVRRWTRGSETSGLLWEFTLTDKEEVIARVKIRQMWVEREKWMEMRRYMRRGRGLPPVPVIREPLTTKLLPLEVGRINPANVVLEDVVESEGAFWARAVIDIRHPVLFDHAIDHVYAMVQLEACKQLAIVSVSRKTGCLPSSLAVTGCSASFESTGEFDLDLELIAYPDLDSKRENCHVVRISIVQQGRSVSGFELSIERA